MSGSLRHIHPLARAAFGAGRVSTQRLQIATACDSLRGRAFTVDELAEQPRLAQPRIGLATVYRAVAAMEAAGYIEAVGARDGAVLYTRCPAGAHHHHVVCTSCSAVTDVECPTTLASGAGGAGFTVTGHRLVIYGLCPACDGRSES